MLLFKTIKQYS